jgi:hypothetical protein
MQSFADAQSRIPNNFPEHWGKTKEGITTEAFIKPESQILRIIRSDYQI